MAQLRQEYAAFQERDAEILVVGPENADAFRRFFAEHDLPFIGLPDPDHIVLKRFGQEVRLFKLGRLPAQVIVDTLRPLHGRHPFQCGTAGDSGRAAGPASEIIADITLTCFKYLDKLGDDSPFVCSLRCQPCRAP